MNRCVLCHKGVHGRRRLMMTIPKLDWERQKMVIEDLEAIDEKLKKQIWNGKHNKKLLCKKHAPRMQMWKEEQRKLNPKPRKQWDWKYLVWSNPELRERMREHIRQGGSPENFAPPVEYPDGTVRVSTPFGEVQRQSHSSATEWLPSSGCEFASGGGRWEQLPPSAGGWEQLPPSAGGWEQLPPSAGGPGQLPSAGRWGQLPPSAGRWDQLPPSAGGPGQLPSAGRWGQLPPSAGRWDQLPPSAGGRGQLPPSAGGWEQLPPSAGGWEQLPPSAGGWEQLPHSAGRWDQLPHSAGRWDQLPPTAGRWDQLPPSAGRWGQLPPSAGRWDQLPPSAGGPGQLPSAGRWGQLPPSAGRWDQLPPSAGGPGQLPSAGRWGQLPPSAGRWDQLPPSAGGRGQLPPSAGGCGQLPPSAGRWGQLPRGQLPPSAGGWAQLPVSAGGCWQLPDSAGGRGQLPPSAGRWGQLPDSAGGCGQLPASAGGSKKLPIKREPLDDGQMPGTSCENLSSGYGTDLSATEENPASELESWKRKIKTELEDTVAAPTTTKQDVSMPPPGSNYSNPFPLRGQYEPSCVGINYNPQANARSSATEWLPSSGCESAGGGGRWEQLPPSAGGWEQLPPSAGGWEQLPPSAGGWDQLPPSAGRWDQLPPTAGRWDQLPPSAGRWGQLPPSAGRWDQLPPSAGGPGQLPSAGRWGQLPPSAGRWDQLPPSAGGRGQLPPSAGGWGQLPPSAGRWGQLPRGQLPPSAGGWAQLPVSAGGCGQLPDSAGGRGQLPPSAGRWGQLPDSAGGCGQLPASAGGSKELPIKREPLDGQMPETSCENLSSGYGTDLSATEENPASELESWKRKIKTELEDTVAAPTTTKQDVSMPPPGSNYSNPFPLRGQYEPSCVGINYNPQANARLLNEPTTFYCTLCASTCVSPYLCVPRSPESRKNFVKFLVGCTGKQKQEIFEDSYFTRKICAIHAPEIHIRKEEQKAEQRNVWLPVTTRRVNLNMEQSEKAEMLGLKGWQMAHQRNGWRAETTETTRLAETTRKLEDSEKAEMLGMRVKRTVKGTMKGTGQRQASLLEKMSKTAEKRVETEQSMRKRGKFRCLICRGTGYSPALVVPSNPWPMEKFIGFLIDCPEELKQEMLEGKWRKERVCAFHAPGMQDWKKRWRSAKEQSDRKEHSPVRHSPGGCVAANKTETQPTGETKSIGGLMDLHKNNVNFEYGHERPGFSVSVRETGLIKLRELESTTSEPEPYSFKENHVVNVKRETEGDDSDLISKLHSHVNARRKIKEVVVDPEQNRTF